MKRPLAVALALVVAVLTLYAKFGVAAAVLTAAAVTFIFVLLTRLGNERLVVPLFMVASVLSIFVHLTMTVAPSNLLNGENATLEGKVTGITHYYSDRYIAEVDMFFPSVKLSLFYDGDILEIGDKVKFSGTVTSTVENASADWLTSWYRSENNLLQISHGEIIEVEEGGAKFISFMARAREFVVSFLPEGLPRALILGDRSALSPLDVAAFEKVGLAHMLAFSGTHFMVLTVGLGLVFETLGFDARRTSLLSLLFIFFIMAFMGFRISVVRAGIMAIVMNVGRLLRRRPDTLTSLFIAAAAICLLSPFATLSTSLLLSFFSVLGIVLLADSLTLKTSSKIINAISSVIAVTISATVGASVVTLLIFGALPLLSVPANLLTFWPMMAIMAFAPFMGGFIGHALSNYCLTVVRHLASVEGTLVYSRNSAVWISLVAILFVYLACLVYNKKADKLAAIITLLLIFTFAAFTASPTPEHGLTVVMVDVGQGSSFIVTDGDYTFVYDLGSSSMSSPEEVVADMLHSMGIYKVDGLVLSHGDYDHISGTAEFLEIFEVENVFTPQGVEIEGIDSSIEVKNGEDLVYDIGDADITISAKHIPIIDALEVEGSNDRSLVMSVVMGESSMLFIGDLTTVGEHALMAVGIEEHDILALGHHGSNSSSGEQFLATISPEICLIPVGRNTYGHPHPDVLARASKHADYIYRSDTAGHVEIITTGDGTFTLYSEENIYG